MKQHSIAYLKAEQVALGDLSRVIPVSGVSAEALSLHRPLMPLLNKFSDFLKNVANSVSFSMPGKITEILTTKRADKTVAAQLAARIGKVDYVDLRELRVAVTPGLSVTWLEYLDAYRHPVEFCISLYDDYLQPFEKFLAQAVTSPESLTSVNRLLAIKALDVPSMKNSIAAPLKGNIKVAVRKYGECADRNSDAVRAVELTDDLGDGLASANLDLVNGSVENIKTLLEQLGNQITDTNLPYRFNAKMIKELSEVTFTIAELVEFYAAVYTKFASHKQAMSEATKTLLSVLPR